MVPDGCTNLAAKKKVTSSDSAPIIGELSLVTDGDKDGSDGSFVELAPGKQWVQIDLEKPADISAIVVWHYHAEGRVYHSVVVQISDDPEFTKDVKTVFNNDFANALGFGVGKQLEYIDDYRGKAIAVKDEKGGPVRGRYVRLYSNGNTSNDQNHYIEVEVYGKPAQMNRMPRGCCLRPRCWPSWPSRPRCVCPASPSGPCTPTRPTRRSRPGGSTKRASTNTTPPITTAPASIG